MSGVIGYGFMFGVLYLAARLLVRGLKRGKAEGWHVRAPWVRRLHGDLD